MVDRRMWLSMSPLRQFKGNVAISSDLLRKLERKDFPWSRYYDLNPQELGELVRAPKMGKTLHKLVHQFPKIDVQAHVQPITRSMIKVDLALTPNFEYDPKCHGTAELFWVIVEDADGEVILYVDNLLVKAKYSTEEHLMSFTVPLFEPLAPNYFISVISDRWIQSETKLPISFAHLILPDKYPAPTELLDLLPLSISAFKDKSIESLYENEFETFNAIQTQTFSALYGTDENVFVAAPTGSGKSICAEIAALRMWKKKKTGKAVYIVPYEELAEGIVQRWTGRFSGMQGKLGGKVVAKLTGEMSVDLRLLESSDVVVSSPEKWVS